MFHFYWPWFALLLPLPLLIRMLPSKTEKNGGKEAPIIYFPSLQRLQTAFMTSKTVDTNTNRTDYILLLLVWVGLIFALMQPEKVDQLTHVHNEGYDLMLAVDISPSMKALDFSTKIKKQDRLDVTKEVVGNFVKGRHGDRIGLIIFGEHTYQHVPLTLDTLSVSQMLEDTLPGMAGQATAIGDSIGLAVRTLRERPEGSRVLVLLTDGEDNASHIPPLEAAKLAKQYGIKIYTIGVGTTGSVPFPNQFGGYQMVQMTLDEDLLKEIAFTTGGQYFHATDKESLERIYHEIDTLEKTEANTEHFLVREPLYYYPLTAALFFMILSILRPIYRSVLYGV